MTRLATRLLCSLMTITTEAKVWSIYWYTPSGFISREQECVPPPATQSWWNAPLPHKLVLIKFDIKVPSYVLFCQFSERSNSHFFFLVSKTGIIFSVCLCGNRKHVSKCSNNSIIQNALRNPGEALTTNALFADVSLFVSRGYKNVNWKESTSQPLLN